MSDAYLTVPLVLFHLWVTIGMGRRFFGCSWMGAIWRAGAMLYGVHFALTTYRFLLFQLTFWQVS
jgi:hypothetical protein